MSSFTYLLCLIAFCLSSTSQEIPKFCKNLDVPASIRTTTFAGIHQVQYVSSVRETDVTLTIKNLLDKRIVQAFVVVEFMGKDNETVIARTQAQAELEGKSAEMPNIHGFSYATHFRRAVRKGEFLDLVDSFDTQTTNCPRSARITDIEVRYEDGSWNRESVSGWQLDPLPAMTSAKPLNSPVAPRRATLQCTISVTEIGDVSAQSCHGASESEISDLNSILGNWKLVPGKRDGRPVQQTISAWIDIFDTKSWAADDAQSQAQRHTILRFADGHFPFATIWLSPLTRDGSLWQGWWNGERIHPKN
jgi:hypothetical protein